MVSKIHSISKIGKSKIGKYCRASIVVQVSKDEVDFFFGRSWMHRQHRGTILVIKQFLRKGGDDVGEFAGGTGTSSTVAPVDIFGFLLFGGFVCRGVGHFGGESRVIEGNGDIVHRTFEFFLGRHCLFFRRYCCWWNCRCRWWNCRKFRGKGERE